MLYLRQKYKLKFEKNSKMYVISPEMYLASDAEWKYLVFLINSKDKKPKNEKMNILIMNSITGCDVMSAKKAISRRCCVRYFLNKRLENTSLHCFRCRMP